MYDSVDLRKILRLKLPKHAFFRGETSIFSKKGPFSKTLLGPKRDPFVRQNFKCRPLCKAIFRQTMYLSSGTYAYTVYRENPPPPPPRYSFHPKCPVSVRFHSGSPLVAFCFGLYRRGPFALFADINNPKNYDVKTILLMINPFRILCVHKPSIQIQQLHVLEHDH